MNDAFFGAALGATNPGIYVLPTASGKELLGRATGPMLGITTSGSVLPGLFSDSSAVALLTSYVKATASSPYALTIIFEANVR